MSTVFEFLRFHSDVIFFKALVRSGVLRPPLHHLRRSELHIQSIEVEKYSF